MAEVQKNTLAGESIHHFVQFIMMHQQQTQLALGAHPNPPRTPPPPNYGLAKAFIDQLSAIKERTRGNLTPEEENMINNSLATLEALYLEKTGSPR
jgi:hypothetical protein